MSAIAKSFFALALSMVLADSVGFVPEGHGATASQQAQTASSANRRIGVVKSLQNASITLTPDSGADITITVQPTTHLVRVAPGEKDLKNAAAIQLQDIQIGDRILVGGKAADDNQTFVASSIVVMKRSDLESKHEQDLQDWQKRGVDGLARSMDATAGSVTISVRSKDMVIHVSGNTVIRRYAPDSVKFDDARLSTLRDIHPGDQVRARGERSADGSELAAAEIVSGAFPLFAGTVTSTNADASTVSVHDLASRKNVVVKITRDSQLHQLPSEMAQRIAAHLKGGAVGAGRTGAAGNVPPQTADPNSSGAPAGAAMAARSGWGVDLQAILNRAPAISLADLRKGDAVVILSTEGAGGSGTAITLYSGVEPILQAAPNAAQAMMLAPWSLGAPSADIGGP